MMKHKQNWQRVNFRCGGIPQNTGKLSKSKTVYAVYVEIFCVLYPIMWWN